MISIVKLVDGTEILGEVVSHNGDRYTIKSPFYIKEIETEEMKSFILKPVSKFIVDYYIQISDSKVMIHPYEVDSQILIESYQEHIRVYTDILNNTMTSISNQTKTLKMQKEISNIIKDNDFLKVSLLMSPVQTTSIN